MNRLFRLVALLTVFTFPIQAKEIGGIDMPNSLEANGTALSLNGAGIRSKMFMDIYVGGLYLIAPSQNADDIIKADKTMAMRLHMVSSLITSKAMEEATLAGFEQASGGKTEQIAEPVDAFLDVFRETISENDVFDIIYVSGKGVDVYKNNVFISTVKGDLHFKQALFAIWLGNKPAHKKLKQGMLGN